MRVLQDLKNARTIVQWVAWAEPDYDFGPVMDEWCNEVPKELDFNLEAGNHILYWFCGPCFDSFKFVSHLVLSVHLSCFLLICGQYLIQGSVDSFRFGWDLAQVSVSRFWF